MFPATKTKIQETQNTSQRQLQELATALFPSIRAEENINLAEVKELIQDWQSAMKDIDNLHQQSSTSKTLQEFSKDYLTLNRENQQHKSRIKQLENEIANLKILAELENQELAAKIQVLPK